MRPECVTSCYTQHYKPSSQWQHNKQMQLATASMPGTVSISCKGGCVHHILVYHYEPTRQLCAMQPQLVHVVAEKEVTQTQDTLANCQIYCPMQGQPMAV
jgi:hypothetical protein